MTRSLKFTTVALVLLAAATRCPRQAAAQLTTAATARITQLTKMAMDNYDGLEFEKAKTQLLEAVKLAEQAAVKDKALVGQVYLNLGVVIGAGFNDKDAATKYFVAALKLDRQLKIPAARATPTLEEMFKAALASLGPEVPAAGAFKHRVVDEAERETSVLIEVEIDKSLGARQVVLFYRKSSGGTTFDKRVLAPRGDKLYVAEIPASDVVGRSIYYYVEAHDKAGGRLAGSGEAASPNIITIVDGGGKGDGKDPGGDDEAKAGGDGRQALISVAVMGGTGFGLVFGGESEHAQPRLSGGNEIFKKVEISPGGALAPVHIAGEIAYHLDEHWQIAALVRVQLVTALEGEHVEDSVSLLGLLRAKRFFGRGIFRPLLSFGAGGGQIRHRIPLEDYDADPSTDDNVVDARVAGIAALSFGGGFQLAFSRHVGVLVELIGLFTVPDFSAHADLNAGLVLSF